MRVVGGELSGRLLPAKVGAQVRPTSDRVRGAIANMVDARYGFDDAVVGDLCCGTGALGIEALSRGAAHVTFVDNHAGSVAATRQNLAAVGVDLTTDPRATVVRSDVLGWRPARPLDLVLVDPPYAFDGWPALLHGLAEAGVLVDGGLLVAESDRALEDDVVHAAGWDVQRVRKHGGTVVTVLAHLPVAPVHHS